LKSYHQDTKTPGTISSFFGLLVFLCIWGISLFGLHGCGLFEPRTPEDPDPTQGSLNAQPPTEPDIVITNLQSAIEQKNVANYMNCFADPLKSSWRFIFIPSADASALYAGVLSAWTRDEEQAYFQNLIARSPASAFARLVLTQKSKDVSADSVVYSYDYSFTFEHSDPGFPRTAVGNLQFSLGIDNNNFWVIYRWTDFKTTDGASWSLFKGKFAN
jgi:hypothetical protein